MLHDLIILCAGMIAGTVLTVAGACLLDWLDGLRRT